MYGRLENKPRNGNDNERQKWGSGGRMMVIRTSERLSHYTKVMGVRRTNHCLKTVMNVRWKSQGKKMVMNPVIKIADRIIMNIPAIDSKKTVTKRQ